MADFNQIEFCYLAEDTDPKALTMKIYLPKLQGLMNFSSEAQDTSVNTNIVLNNDGGGVSSNAKNGAPIVARVVDPPCHKHEHHDCAPACPNKSHCNSCGKSSSILSVCHHQHHHPVLPHNDAGVIPAGTKMICILMNNNPKDIWVTRWLMEWEGREMQWFDNSHDPAK